MNKVIFPQLIVTVLGTLLLWMFAAPHQDVSYLVGSLLILLSFILLGIGYGLIFKKKLVALAIGIIVFKYAILGIIIYTLIQQSWFDRLWFAMGIASFVLSALIYAIRESIKEGNDHVI